MRLSILIANFLIIQSCATFEMAPHFNEFIEAKNNFHYKHDVSGEVYQFSSISYTFVGDCEDFALTFCGQLDNGQVWIARLKKYGENDRHAVCVSRGWVYDNRLKDPVTVKWWQRQIGWLLTTMNMEGLQIIYNKETQELLR